MRRIWQAHLLMLMSWQSTPMICTRSSDLRLRKGKLVGASLGFWTCRRSGTSTNRIDGVYE